MDWLTVQIHRLFRPMFYCLLTISERCNISWKKLLSCSRNSPPLWSPKIIIAFTMARLWTLFWIHWIKSMFCSYKMCYNIHKILCSSPNISRVIKSGKMKWRAHVARMEEMKKQTKFWSQNLKGKDHSEDLGVDGRIILEWILGI